MRLRFLTLLLFPLVLAASADCAGAADRPETRVAVQTIGEPAAIVETIATTLDHIRDEVPSRRFMLEYYDRSELPGIVVRAEAPMIFITDPVTYASLASAGSGQAVASMKEREALDAGHTTGAAFIVRSDRTDLSSLADLRGQTIEAAEKTAGESYIIAMHEIRRIFGEDKFFGETRLVPAFSEQIVHDVAAGKADAGIVEACLLEEMEAKGNIEKGALRVVGERSSRDLRCRHSTELYPGWVLGIAVQNGSFSEEAKALAADIAPALATVPKLIHTFDWAAPSDADAFAALLSELRRQEPGFAFGAFVRQYWPYAALAVLFFLAVLLHGVYVSWLVRRRTAELERVMNEKEALSRLAEEERERMASFERAGIAGQLSSMIAHELTQPLNAIVNYARGLRIRFARGQLDGETLADTLVRIAEQGMTASEIVSRVRGYAKNGESETCRCDLAELLEEAASRFCRARPEAPRPVLRTKGPCFVEGHPMELSLLIHNLLKNADEACRNVASPVIEAEVQSDAGFVRLSVSDNGPEIDEAAMSHLFEPLHTTKAGGLGLGLAICRSIAEAHGGRILAEKSTDGRLVFTLVLPQAAQQG